MPNEEVVNQTKAKFRQWLFNLFDECIVVFEDVISYLHRRRASSEGRGNTFFYKFVINVYVLVGTILCSQSKSYQKGVTLASFILTANYNYFGATSHQQVFLILYRLLETLTAAIKMAKDLRNRIQDSTVIDKLHHLPVCDIDYFRSLIFSNSMQ